MTTMVIRPSRDLRTHYKEVSELCRMQPVAITVNGREDTVLISHNDFMDLEIERQRLKAEVELLTALVEADDDVKLGRVSTLEDARKRALSKYEL